MLFLNAYQLEISDFPCAAVNVAHCHGPITASNGLAVKCDVDVESEELSVGVSPVRLTNSLIVLLRAAAG